MRGRRGTGAADGGWRLAEAAAEHPVEMGKIAEARVIGDRRHLLVAAEGMGEQLPGAVQALLDEMLDLYK